MADGTRIEWTDATVNAVNGCSVLSPGCTNCYAMRLAGTRLKHHPSRAGLTRDTKAGPVWTGEVRLNEKALLEPLRWRRPRMIFWNAHGDLFHPDVPDEWIDREFAVMALTPHHTHQVLTKRPERMRGYLRERQPLPGFHSEIAVEMLKIDPKAERTPLLAKRWPLPNVWLGVSVEDRKRMLERAPALMDTPAAVRWWSAEPLLGDLGDVPAELMPNWVVVGGESGPGARPMHPDWARSLRDQCAAAEVPFHFKQWGAYRPCTEAELKQACSATLVGDRLTGAYMMRVGKKAAGRLLDGVEHDGVPA